MYLTREEERIYDGEHGWAYQVSMKILVRLGDLFGATKLIPIKSAHISGVSYKTLGDAPIDFLDTLASAGAKAQVPSTLNPSSFDTDYLAKNFPQQYKAQQLSIIDLYKKWMLDPSLRAHLTTYASRNRIRILRGLSLLRQCTPTQF